MTDLLVSVLIMLAVGLYKARGRGPVGLVVTVVLVIIGGMVGLWLTGMIMETTMTLVHFEGKLATSHHPLRYVVDVALPIFTVLGSWIPIHIVDWIRSKGPTPAAAR